MAEVRTAPVKAIHIPDKEAFRDEYGQGRVPGSFRIVDDPAGDGEQALWYCCPCGCKGAWPLTIGKGFKPAHSPSWEWNGSFEAPTLIPSVHDVGHWHGWLRDGVWVSC